MLSTDASCSAQILSQPVVAAHGPTTFVHAHMNSCLARNNQLTATHRQLLLQQADLQAPCTELLLQQYC
jgi:hypothetical protein